MKKLFTVMCAISAASVLAADFKLPAKHFKVISGGKSEIVRGEEFFSRAIRLEAAKERAVTAALPHGGFFNFIPAVYEVKAEIKGQGTAFLEIQLLTPDNKIIGQHRVVTRQATARFRDIEGKLDLRGKTFAQPPFKVNVVIGVEQGGDVTFDDIELDIDND